MLYTGELTKEMKAKQAEGYKPGSTDTPASAFQEMEDMMARARALREAQEE